jgi:NADPH:quinone reductase-like Zn-dependent oxidoreductase
VKAVVITKSGGPDVLVYKEWPTPEPKAGEVRIRTRFAGVNFADTTARLGWYPDAPKAPCVIGYEVSGTVDKLGAGVTGLTVGDRVFAMSIDFGGYGELVCVQAVAARKTPDDMSDEQAAALPVVYLTAYHMLHYLTQVRAGDRLLVHAAAGGVGIAAVQMAKAQGAVVFGTSSAAKHPFLRELGVDHCIDYRTQDFVAEVRKLTNGEGVDLVMDALGGSALKKSFSLLRPGGRLFTFGFSRVQQNGSVGKFSLVKEFLAMPRFAPMSLMNDNRAVLGVNMNHMSQRPDIIAKEIDGLLALWHAKVIRPRIDLVVPAGRAAEAHRRLDNGANVGKVLISFAE